MDVNKTLKYEIDPLCMLMKYSSVRLIHVWILHIKLICEIDPCVDVNEKIMCEINITHM